MWLQPFKHFGFRLLINCTPHKWQPMASVKHSARILYIWQNLHHIFLARIGLSMMSKSNTFLWVNSSSISCKTTVPHTRLCNVTSQKTTISTGVTASDLKCLYYMKRNSFIIGSKAQHVSIWHLLSFQIHNNADQNKTWELVTTGRLWGHINLVQNVISYFFVKHIIILTSMPKSCPALLCKYVSMYILSWKRVEYDNLLIMPANGRWDLIRRLKVNTPQ